MLCNVYAWLWHYSTINQMTSQKRKQIQKSHELINGYMTTNEKENAIISLLIVGLRDSANEQQFINGKFNKDVEIDYNKLRRIFEFKLTYVAELMETDVRSLTQMKKDKHGNDMPSALDRACLSVVEKAISVPTNVKGKFRHHSPVIDAGFDPRNEFLTIEINENSLPYLLKYGESKKGFGLIDMKLYFSLNSFIEQRILEFISRFKVDPKKREYTCSIAKFCLMVGVDRDYYNTSNFKMVYIDRPIKNIIKKSKGMWEVKDGYSKGYVTSRKAMPDDDIIFKMKYNDPDEKEMLVSKTTENVAPDGASEDMSFVLKTIQQMMIDKKAAPHIFDTYMRLLSDENLTAPDNIAKIIADFDSSN